MPEIIDDKSQHCVPFLLERLRAHTERHRDSASKIDGAPPFFLGLNGVQGAGKTVLVSDASRISKSSFPFSCFSIS